MPKDNEVDEKVIWSDDLAAVLEAASEASAVPLTWLANREFSPEQTKAWLCDAVDNTVADGAFSGELHGIAEEESGLTVAFTGCGPKSAANAKFLIWCAHFILKHRDSLSDHAATVAELRAEVERLRDTLTAIRQYGSDTLSGRADGGSDDREWPRDAFREMTKRARVGLGIKLPGEE